MKQYSNGDSIHTCRTELIAPGVHCALRKILKFSEIFRKFPVICSLLSDVSFNHVHLKMRSLLLRNTSYKSHPCASLLALKKNRAKVVAFLFGDPKK